MNREVVIYCAVLCCLRLNLDTPMEDMEHRQAVLWADPTSPSYRLISVVSGDWEEAQQRSRPTQQMQDHLVTSGASVLVDCPKLGEGKSVLL